MNTNETKLCQGKDVFERMNYLYQASRLVANNNTVAASFYGNLMVSCAKKAVLRMETHVKRSICKNCKSPLIPGETASIRLVSKPFKAARWTCLACKSTRRFPTKTCNKLWSDQPESVVQVFDYTPKCHDATCSAALLTPETKMDTNVVDEKKLETNVVDEKKLKLVVEKTEKLSVVI